MADVKIDFEQIGAAVLTACPGLLLSWFPRGKVVGHEFEIGNLQGDAGKSLKINFRTGRWSDFATGEARRSNLPLRRQARLDSPVMKSLSDQSVSGATMMTSIAGLPSMFATMAIARAASN